MLSHYEILTMGTTPRPGRVSSPDRPTVVQIGLLSAARAADKTAQHPWTSAQNLGQ